MEEDLSDPSDEVGAAERKISIRDGVVRRPAKPWTPTIQSLLQHLHGKGLPVPKPLGYDSELEYVRLVEGDAGDAAWPHQRDLAGVRSAGALLRQVHDASAGWTPPATSVWSVPFQPSPIICHGDPQPANFAWRDGQAVGLFDWDAARPGGPLGDVAYALLWFIPLNADEDELVRRGFLAVPDRQARAEAFLEGYGWSAALDVTEAAVARHGQAIDEVVWLGDRGHEPHASWVAAGWPDRWRAGMGDLRARSIKVGDRSPRPRK
ncbi:MAG: phosphotransferase [Propionibacteriaceae bacterium]